MPLENLLLLCENPEKLIKKLVLWKVIPEQGAYKCTRCQGTLKLTKQEHSLDGFLWTCSNPRTNNKQCGNRVSIRTGTFFEKIHLSMYEILGFLELWLYNANSYLIHHQLQIAEETVLECSLYCYEVLDCSLLHKKERIGGTGKVVEINELGRRSCACGRKMNGKRLIEAYERGSGKNFAEEIEEKSSATVVAFIHNWIEPGTMIISDCWKSYGCLNDKRFLQLQENYGINIEDSKIGNINSGVDTGNVDNIGEYGPININGLAKKMFLKRCREKKQDRFVEFLKLARELYNPII